MQFLNRIKDKIVAKLISLKKIKINGNGLKYKNSTTSRAVGANYTAEFNTETKRKIEELEVQVKEIVKKYFKEPEALIKYLEQYKLPIYRIKNADAILNQLNEDEGFIIGKKGFKAFTLNNILNAIQGKSPELKFKTTEMFIFDVKDVEIYTVARALYKYFGFKSNLPGYDYKSQEIYKKTKIKKQDMFKGLSPNDIFACKEALSREMESINFTINLSVEYDNSKKAAEKITDDGANI